MSLGKKLDDDGVLIKGYRWIESALRCNMDAMKKDHENEVEGLKKQCTEQHS